MAIEFKWVYRYVPEGQLAFDEFGRWAIDCYVYPHIEKSLPEYEWLIKATGKEHMMVRVATMFQSGSTVGSVPSTINRFCVPALTFDEAGNFGLSTQRNFFSNDIEELKRIIEGQFEKTRNVFCHLLNSTPNPERSVATRFNQGDSPGNIK